MKVIVFLGLIALAFAQDSLDDTVKVDAAWPENKDTNAGFLASFAYAGIGDGSCFFQLPSPVVLFHVLNAHIVGGDFTNPGEGQYKVAAPAGWEMENGTLKVLVYLSRGQIFNATQIDFRCDPSDVAELSVYSCPQNDEVAEASSNVFYRPGYKKGDILTITLPGPVDRFNITGGDSRWIKGTGVAENSYTVSGFVSVDGEPGSDQMKEVHFSIQYRKGTEEEGERRYWFSCGQVTVAVTKEEPEEVEAP